MNTLKIYGTGSATANAVASVVVPVKTRIRAVQWAVMADCITDNGSCVIECSRASANEINVVGAQQCISQVCAYGNFVTSGLAFTSVVVFLPCDIPINQGQIIYIHASITGTITYYATAILHYA